MVSVTDFARVSKVCSSDLRRPSIDSSNDLIRPSSELSKDRSCRRTTLILPSIEVSKDSILLSSEVSRWATRLPSVVSNCTRRWSSEAVISPPFEVRRVSKVST